MIIYYIFSIIFGKVLLRQLTKICPSQLPGSPGHQAEMTSYDPGFLVFMHVPPKLLRRYRRKPYCPVIVVERYDQKYGNRSKVRGDETGMILSRLRQSMHPFCEPLPLAGLAPKVCRCPLKVLALFACPNRSLTGSKGHR